MQSIDDFMLTTTGDASSHQAHKHFSFISYKNKKYAMMLWLNIRFQFLELVFKTVSMIRVLLQ